MRSMCVFASFILMSSRVTGRQQSRATEQYRNNLHPQHHLSVDKASRL